MSQDPYLNLNRDLNELLALSREYQKRIQEVLDSSGKKQRSPQTEEDFLDQLTIAS